MIVVAVAGLGGGALLGCLFAMDNAEDSYWAFIAEVLRIALVCLVMALYAHRVLHSGTVH